MIERDRLARIRIFADLPRDRLEWLADRMAEFYIQQATCCWARATWPPA